ncbi:MAG: hypothetical protein K2I91_06610, partial [Muribaculaceae bacterium]|nr:hypothetical protein [Muribaculaceae bacterium]
MGEDAHTAEIKIDPIIARDPNGEKTYSVEIPGGILKQVQGSNLPSEEANFNITVGKYVKIEDNNYPKYTVSPASNDACSASDYFKTWVFTYYGADAVELGTELPKFFRGTTEVGGAITVTSGMTEDGFPTVTVTLATQQSFLGQTSAVYQLQVPRLAWTISRGDKVYPTEEILTYRVSNLVDKLNADLSWQTRSGSFLNYTYTDHSSTIAYAGNAASEITAEDAAEAFSSVLVTINPSDSGIKYGTGSATLNSVNGTALTSIVTYDKPALGGAKSVSFKPSGTTVTPETFTVGKTYAFKIAKDVIKINGYDPDASGLKTAKDLSMGADIVHYFKIVEEGAGPAQYEERELTLLNTSNGVPRVRLEHLDIAAETDNETYGFAISYKNGGMYIG